MKASSFIWIKSLPYESKNMSNILTERHFEHLEPLYEHLDFYFEHLEPLYEHLA
ncbi:hypothetical protein J2R98_002730 [Alkalibacillus filiformis]|uniref:Uncharacterized protein n=1 Tax=Alkalibacillus filiformis TaxID=200990 RepID=A0ABU0DWM9_9BACI|nr:hypothetical protein [Alkalibacillus filiformis]MDQ0352879.1 hypothetical protein [Alkalibacillus filiformis]